MSLWDDPRNNRHGDEIVCPYCGHEHTDSWEWARIDYTCVAAFPAIIAAKTTAITVRDARAREWAALVEARDAKGGGA